MIKGLVFCLLLAAAGSVLEYPRYEEVVRDPMVSDLLYGTNAGPITETWYFTTSDVNLTSIIIPSQTILCNSGHMNGSYEESIDVFLYETVLASYASQIQTYLKASGSLKGIVSYGQELDIPLWNSTLHGPPDICRYYATTRGCKYTLKIVFKTAGIYPWYTARTLSTYSPINNLTNGPGIAIGLSYVTYV